MKQYTETIQSILREHKLRKTKTRFLLLELLLQSGEPSSASDILCDFLRMRKSVNKTTVYRELDHLIREGIITSLHLGDRKQYYEIANRSHHHHHLICLQCKQIEDIDVNETKLLSEEEKARCEKGFVILRHSLEFFGLCKKCQIIESV